MPAILPYDIVHVHLHQHGQLFSLRASTTAKYYYIFWWQQVPLGHLFVELSDSGNLQSKILETLSAAIDSYTNNEDQKENYRIAFNDSDHYKFASVMKQIFAPYSNINFSNKADISVVICTRNRSENLKVCLDSLHAQVCMPQEILIIDNAPTDDSTKEVVSQFQDVIYSVEERPGLSKARNKGISIAKCPVIAWIDDDVTLHPLWVARIQETFKDPKVQACTGLVLAFQLETESQQIFEKHWSFNRGFQEKIYDSAYFNSKLSDGPPVWEIGAGANMAFTKAIFEEVGYFDERLGAGASGCSEDSEMWYRILNNGYNINYNPRAVVYHTHRKDLKSLHKQIFNYMRGFTVATLIQQEQNANAGYRLHLSKVLPRYYFHLIKQGFPLYLSRYRTVFSEIKGFLSGKKFYYKNKKETYKI